MKIESAIPSCSLAPPRASVDINPETGLKTVADKRRTVVCSSIGIIEDRAVARDSSPKAGRTEADQLVLTYFGMLDWRIGSTGVRVDANRLAFLAAGSEFAQSHPEPAVGHAGLYFTPHPDILDQMCSASSSWPLGSSGLTVRSCPSPLHLLIHRLVRLGPVVDPLAADELGLEILAQALGAPEYHCAGASKIVDQAKQILHCDAAERHSLANIARELGVSPIYLTQAFKRAEGMPLYRYHLLLRLNRALFELPERDSLIDLALALGFSSHSHFTCAFRSAFGVTPSALRTMPGVGLVQ